MKGARFFVLVLALLALASVPTAAAPLADPCPPGTAYHPACDVDQNNQINIFDIQRTASRFNQSGTWVSDNQHNHLGQEWNGVNNALKLTGYYGAPDDAPLVLSNSGSFGLRVALAGYAGVSVGSADYGVKVDDATYNGLFVDAAGYEGVYVDEAGYDGVRVYEAGNQPLVFASASHNGFEVDGAEGNGVYVGHAGEDGIHVASAIDDGIQIGALGTTPYFGLYTPPPGTTGTTLLPDTSAVNHEWALYTDDKIYVRTVAARAHTLVAVVGGDQSLAAGDVVAAAGLAAPMPGDQERLVLVRLASADLANIVGVVSGRMALQPLPGKAGVEEMRSVDGPARPGDYVAITVLGVAQVKVQAGETIQPGQRLTAADTPGFARALRTVQVEGVVVDESGPVIGVALDGVEDGLVWVLVNPQ